MSKMTVRIRWREVAFSAVAVTCCLTATQAFGQSSSMFGAPGQRSELTLSNTSFFFQEPPAPREIRLHDIITVIVDQRSQVVSEGEIQRRQQSNINAVLTDWIRLRGFDLKPAPQLDGDPGIRAQLNGQLRAQNELETRDAMKFIIAAEVVDIRPNGNLVLQAQRTVQNNNEIWEQFLVGIVRQEDVLPNNKVLSENIAQLSIYKREMGQVRDAYKRGWLLRLFDRYKPL